MNEIEQLKNLMRNWTRDEQLDFVKKLERIFSNTLVNEAWTEQAKIFSQLRKEIKPMAKNLIVPQNMVEFLNIENANEVEYKRQPNGTIVIRKKRIPEPINECIVLKCRDYIYRQISDSIRMSWDFNIDFDRKNLRTTVQATNKRTEEKRVGHAKLDASSEIYESAVGIAIALCRAINGKHCDYQNIIGFKMK